MADSPPPPPSRDLFVFVFLRQVCKVSQLFFFLLSILYSLEGTHIISALVANDTLFHLGKLFCVVQAALELPM